MNPKISVIVPLYNKEHYIANVIESVLKQTFQDFEILVINDGSKDKGAEIVLKYTADIRIRLINQENQGVSIARNRGVSEAKSDIVAFLDADDEWRPNFLETILFLFEKYPEAGLYATAHAIYIDNKFSHSIVLPPKDQDRIIKSYFKEHIIFGKPIIQTSACAMPKDIFLKIGGFDTKFRVGQDQELFNRVALYYDIAYTPQVCSNYTMNAINGVDKVNFEIKIPFYTNIDEIYNADIKIRHKLSDLKDYLDYCYLKIGGRNIYSDLERWDDQKFQWFHLGNTG